MKKRSIDKIKINKIIIFFMLLFFIAATYRMTVLSLSNNIDGLNLKDFAENRNTRKKTLYAKRGNIYDFESNILAQTVNSYTVIAFLDPSRSKGFKTPKHVVNKEKTAEELSRIINMSKENILLLLNRNAYQVELGPGGREISELTKEKIENLNLPGIGFVASNKRYYPNGDFLSYIIGYVKTNDSGQMIGEMGLEGYYDEILKGKNGSFEYIQDLNGYKIPNTPEIITESENGKDIYLTIDSNIQFFAERNTKASFEKYNPEWAITVVADAKTGAILASSSYPSFDPNKKNITNYLNPLVSYAFEPGSTMKTFSFMSIMEKKIYDGTKKFESGKIYVNKDIISDWKPEGWGILNFDQGFTLSANTGASTLIKNFSSGKELAEFYKKLGFGEKTNIELPGERNGVINFKYQLEVANASFGQGITVTPIQMIKALTSISNDGVLLQPYIVEKIVDQKTKNIDFENAKKELKRVVSIETVNNIKRLMYDTVNGDPSFSTGSPYKIDGYDVIGKTGTAQYTNPLTGKYFFGGNNYIRSFAGMFPKDEPEYIVYVAVKKPEVGGVAVSSIVQPLIKDIANYKGLFNETKKLENIKMVKMPNLLNKTTENSNEILKDFKKVVILGDGNKIIKQYPLSNSNVNCLDKVFLLTESKEIKLKSVLGYSLKDLKTLSTISNIKFEYEGSGYVYYENFEDDILKVKLKNKIDKDNF